MRTYKRSARIALVALVGFTAIVGVEHAVRSGLSPARHQISEYVHGPYGWLMTAGFVAWSASFLLHGASTDRHWARVGLLLAAAATSLLAAFPTQTVAGRLPAGVVRTWEGRLHDRAVLALVAGLGAAALAVMADPRCGRGTRMSVAVALMLGVGSTAAFLAVGDPWPGWRQRALLSTAVLAQAAMVVERRTGRSRA